MYKYTYIDTYAYMHTYIQICINIQTANFLLLLLPPGGLSNFIYTYIHIDIYIYIYFYRYIYIHI